MMSQQFRIKAVIVLFLYGFILVFIGGCAIKQQPTEQTPIEQTPQPKPFTADLEPDNYRTEIEKLNEIIKNNPDRSERIKAQGELASLYSSYKNPKKDYKKALAQLKDYTALDPEAAEQYDVQDKLSILKEIERLSKKVADRDRKLKKLKKLKKRNADLDRENKELKQAIEKLKILDLQLEQKRKSYQ